MQTIYLSPTPDRTFFIEVLGESHYQKDIKEIVAYKIMVDKDDMEHRDYKLIAHLILEDENKFDPGNAVRVEIDNKQVGYLGKNDARKYRKGLTRNNLTDVEAICRAAAFGQRLGTKMNYGIWLSFDLDHLTLGTEQEVIHPKKKGCGIFVLAFLLITGTIFSISHLIT